MNLLIDIGNSCAKLTVIDRGEVLAHRRTADGWRETLSEMVAEFSPEACAYCCVGAEAAEWRAELDGLSLPVLCVTGATPSPLHNGYLTPETLGADRLAAVVGAAELMPQTDLLVVDAGTCVTYDFVDAAGNYRGGNISPGLEMRFAALHEHTARLPRVAAEGPLPETGCDTETAIRAGVVRGMAFELEGYIRRFAATHPALRVFVTGGNVPDVAEDLRPRLCADAHLVARGLDRMLRDRLENDNTQHTHYI